MQAIITYITLSYLLCFLILLETLFVPLRLFIFFYFILSNRFWCLLFRWLALRFLKLCRLMSSPKSLIQMLTRQFPICSTSNVSCKQIEELCNIETVDRRVNIEACVYSRRWFSTVIESDISSYFRLCLRAENPGALFVQGMSYKTSYPGS